VNDKPVTIVGGGVPIKADGKMIKAAILF